MILEKDRCLIHHRTVSPNELVIRGFELIKQGSVEPSLIIGTPKNTMGKPLDTSVMIQAIFRKIK